MSERLKSWLLPSVADVFFVSVFLYLATSGDKGKLLGDGDTGYHIRAGDYIINTLSIPKNDIFSHITPTLPWTAHEWLAEVLMAILHQFGGLSAVVVAFSLLIAIAVRIFFHCTRAAGNNLMLTLIATIMFVALAKSHLLARPHIFSLIILLVWYQILDDFQYRQKNRLWILPLLMVIWVNLHGGFIIGLVLLGVYCSGNYFLRFTDKREWEIIGKDRAIKLAMIFGIAIITCLANPIGYKIFLFPIKLVSNKFIMDHVSEFLSPNFHEIQPFKYLLLLMIVLFANSKKKPNFIEIVLTILFTSMSLTSIRYIPLFAVITIPVLLRYIEPGCLVNFPKVESFFLKRVDNITLIDSSAKGYFWTATSVLVIILLTAQGALTHSLSSEKKPLAALEFLRKNPVSGNMFNNDEFGDMVIYTSHLHYKVFIDGRLDMYGSEKLKEYAKVIYFEPGWETVLEKYKISWIFFDTNSTFARFLSINKEWKLIYSDKVASIFVQNILLYKTLTEKFPDVKLALNHSGADK